MISKKALYMRSRRDSGRCCSCKNKALKGKWRCKECLEKSIISNRMRYVPHPLPRLSKEEKRKRQLARVRKCTFNKKLKGLCNRCSNKVEVGKSRCRPCLDKTKKEQVIYSKKVGRYK